MAISIIPVETFIVSIIGLLVNKPELMANFDEFNILDFWQIILTLCITPAIFEEIVFRGIFVKEYENCSFWYAVFFSGLFFGIMHLTIDQLFYTTISGMIMAILVKVTGSIWSSILYHFVTNATPNVIGIIVKILILTNENNVNNSIASMETPVNSLIVKLFSTLILSSFLAISVLFLILGFYMLIKVNKEKIDNIKNIEAVKKKNNSNIFNVYFVMVILVYLTVMILNSMN